MEEHAEKQDAIKDAETKRRIEELEIQIEESRKRMQKKAEMRELQRSKDKIEIEAAAQKMREEMGDVFDTLESEHPANSLHRIDYNDGRMVVVKKPKQLSYMRFIQKGRNEELTSKDCDTLIKDSLVYPDVATYNKMHEELPGMQTEICNACVELAGFRVKKAMGK